MTERVRVWINHAVQVAPAAVAGLVIAAGLPARAAGVPQPGEPPFTYVQVSTRIAKPGRDGAATATESVTNEVLRVSRGLSHWRRSPSRRPWPFMQVRRTSVKPAMLDQYLAASRAIRDARVEAQTTPELRWHVVEGSGFVFGSTRYFRGWQDRDLWEDELAFVLGPEEYSARMAQLTASIDRTETFVLRYREDLSRAIKAERTDQ